MQGRSATHQRIYCASIAICLIAAASPVPAGAIAAASHAAHANGVRYQPGDEGDYSSEPMATKRGDGRESGSDERALLHDINALRVADGLTALDSDARLGAVAKAHAEDMIARGYFGHATPEGKDPFNRIATAGIPFGYAGENLGTGEDERDAEARLYRSLPHRENMLEPHYRAIGVAVYATYRGVVVVEDFID